MMTHLLNLPGCTPTPLSHYLKALGVLRLVAEQADPQAKGCWRNDRFELTSSLDRAALEAFFLERYRPTPMVAPWNGGSGFYPKDKKDGIEAVGASHNVRFLPFAQVIAFSHTVVLEAHLDGSPKGDEKARLLARFRARAPESVLAWFDASVFLSLDKPGFPPLLGTGGNDGRLDFTNNYMQRLTQVFDAEDGAPNVLAGSWLAASLFSDETPGLLANVAIGQFNPGGVGGPNASTGFEANSLVNPWDFVLMLEGALLFAAASSRRLEQSAGGGLSYPFTVRTTGAGGAAAAMGDEKDARAEIWMPLWSRPAALHEIRALLAEGRARLGRFAVRDGLGFARAIAGFGVDRGIAAFERYGFLMRSGKAYIAAPLGRFEVRHRPEAVLIEDLDQYGFLDRLRRHVRDPHAPAAIGLLVHRFEEALLRLTQAPNRATVQSLLVLLGRIIGLLGRSAKGRDAVPMVPRLSVSWFEQAQDVSPELRIAAALASMREPFGGGTAIGLAKGLPMALHLYPLKNAGKGWRWDPSSRLHTWSDAPLTRNLEVLLRRRLLASRGASMKDKPFSAGLGVTEADLYPFLRQSTDDQRIAGLLGGLALCELPRRFEMDGPSGDQILPAAYTALKPFFTPDWILRRYGLMPKEAKLALKDDLVALLGAQRLNGPDGALARAWTRLRAAGWALPRSPRTPPAAPPAIDAQRLLAALLVPVAAGELTRMLNRTAKS